MVFTIKCLQLRQNNIKNNLILLFLYYNKDMKLFFRFILVTIAAFLIAVNIDSFIYSAHLLPGGFSGIVLLLQDIFEKYLNITIPYSLFYWLLNIAPAIMCFKFVGKKFTLLSIWMIISSGLFTDLLPHIEVTNDVVLCAVFGGLLQGFAVCLTLFAGATSGGTDFISIYFAQKTGKDIWNIIFFSNCVVLAIYGFLFEWSYALYSIIFQFANTQIINTFYKRYKKTTLLVITQKPEEVVTCIKENTHHDATKFTGVGCHTGLEKTMLYSVVSSDQEKFIVKEIKEIDPEAFINILQSKDINGKFFMRKND